MEAIFVFVRNVIILMFCEFGAIIQMLTEPVKWY